MAIIAVIDDGVSTSEIDDLAFDLEVDSTLSIKDNSNQHIDNDSHGTICARIIKKYAPDAVLGSIKILDSDTKTGFVNSLKTALEWCVDNKISLVNLSLGSTQSQDYEPLRKVVDYVYDNGVIIVAAVNNRNILSYPASFPNVIGVSMDLTLTEEMYYMVPPDIRGIDVYASSNHDSQLIAYIGNSYAAPLITSKVYKIIQKNNVQNIKEIRLSLSESTDIKAPNNNIIRDKDEEIEVPCIVVYISDENRLNIVSEVNKLFIKNGYNTLLLSSGKLCNNDKAYRIDKNHLNNQSILSFYEKVDADIVIIGITKAYVNSDLYISCDILFYEQGLCIERLLKPELAFYFDSKKQDAAGIIYKFTTKILS